MHLLLQLPCLSLDEETRELLLTTRRLEGISGKSVQNPVNFNIDTSRGNKCQLMALFREVTEPAVFVPQVAEQHDVFVRAIAFRVVVIARTSF